MGRPDFGPSAGPRGEKGEQGDRGPRGPKGEIGPPGAPAKQPLIVGWKIDTKRFRALPFGGDSRPLAELDLYPLFELFARQMADSGDAVREELKKLLPLVALGAL